MANLNDVRKTPRSQAHVSLSKCREMLAGAEASLGAARWDAAGLDAVHSGICGADAVLIATSGLRSASKDHGALVSLLENLVPEFKTEQRRHLGGLLKMKNRVEYEQRPLTETEAKQLVDHARRLARWSERVVAAHLGA